MSGENLQLNKTTGVNEDYINNICGLYSLVQNYNLLCDIKAKDNSSNSQVFTALSDLLISTCQKRDIIESYESKYLESAFRNEILLNISNSTKKRISAINGIIDNLNIMIDSREYDFLYIMHEIGKVDVLIYKDKRRYVEKYQASINKMVKKDRNYFISL